MADLVYRKAGIADLEILTETRVEVLRAVFGIGADEDMSQVRNTSRSYYESSLAADRHVAYLVFDRQADGEKFAGAGGVSFYQVMPTCENPTGEKAYVMNMYTRPEYRNRGIAGHTLELLIREAKVRGITYISLDASEMGRPVYERHGFAQMTDMMKLEI